MLQTSSYLNFESKECLQYNGLMVTSGHGYIFQQTLVNEKFTDTNTVTNVFSSLKKKKKPVSAGSSGWSHSRSFQETKKLVFL